MISSANNEYVEDIQHIHETLRKYKNEIDVVQTKLHGTNIQNEKLTANLVEIDNEMAS